MSFPSLWPESQTITTIPLKKARMVREKNNSLSYFSYPLIPGSQYELLIQGWYTQSRKKLQDWFKTTKSIFSASRLGLALQAQSMIAVVLGVTRHRKKILKNRKTFANKLAGILLHWKFSSQQFNTSFKKFTTIRTKILLTSDTLILTKPSLCLRL